MRGPLSFLHLTSAANTRLNLALFPSKVVEHFRNACIAMRILLVLALLLSACSAPVEQERFLGAYRCEADVVFEAWQRAAGLRIDLMGQEHVLQTVASDELQHYAGENLEAWQEEDRFLVLLGSRRYECALDETVMRAIERGVDYRAVGQEPGWLLEIFRDEKMVLHYDYGGERAEFSYDRPQRGEGAMTYQLESGEQQLVVRMAIAPCHDAMSGQPYPDTVSVYYRDETLERELQGCGRPLPAAE